MISTGTGVAPFISFLQHYSSHNQDINHLILFFGSKNRNSDFIYEQELNQFKDNKILQNLHLAFSRDQVK